MSGEVKAGVPAEVMTQVPFLVANDNWFQHVFPVICTVDVAGTEGTPFQIAELVEKEKGMVAGAAEVAVVGRSFLVAMGRADAAVHVENDLRRRVPVMNPVNPSAGKIGKRGEVFFGGQNLRLEATHLTA